MHQTSVDQGIRGLKQSEKLECTLDESGSGPDYQHRVHLALLLPVCIFDRLFLKKIKIPMIQNVFIFPNFQLKIQKKSLPKIFIFCYSQFSSEMCVIFV